MDTSDFYDTAVAALDALEASVPTCAANNAVSKHAFALKELRWLVKLAEAEMDANNTIAAHRCNNAKNNRKDA